MNPGPNRAAWGILVLAFVLGVWSGPALGAGAQAGARVSPDEIRARERSIISRLDELDRQRLRVQRNRQRLGDDLAALGREEEEARIEADQLEKRKSLLAGSLSQRIKALYLHGRTGLVRLSLASRSVREVALGQTVLVRIVKFDLKLMEDYNVLQKELEGLNQALALRKKKMSDLLAELAEADSEVAAQRAARARLLLRVDRSREDHDSALEELNRAEADLNERLASLERALPAKPGSGLLALGKGRLPWPVEGVVKRMADRKRKGVLIGVEEGAPVRAVGDGKVIHAGWIKGYGLVVIIDHGARYYTLSAHLEEIRTKTGDKVHSGQVIGSSGRAGLAPPGVYFEIRHRDKTLDSGAWLGESSG